MYFTRDPLDDETIDRRRWLMWVTTRATIAAIVVGWITNSVVLPLVLLASAVVLPLVRARIPGRYCAELEIGANVVFASAAFLVVQGEHLDVERTFFTLPFSNQRIAVACIVVALMFLTVNGGTYVVRGLLKKSGAVPKVTSGENQGAIDMREFNRGRLIGALERTLLFAVVIAGSFEALGFIVAAKGLIRSREFELSRDMTEYFLIGSLASVLIALTTGGLARLLLHAYW
ncbi:MAG TPA: hypothetical protein VNI54_12690 [Thermoanaerobaculia bacterium]|nr:hypothetical protein [Thermoanaerobaculia bacterium]